MNRWPVAVDQPRAFAAHRFGDQAAAAAGDVEHRGMELHELHVAQLGAGAIGDRVAVAGGDVGIGRLAIDLPAPPVHRIVCLAQTNVWPCSRVPHQRPAATPFVRQQIERERVRPDLGVVLRARSAR